MGGNAYKHNERKKCSSFVSGRENGEKKLIETNC